MRSGFKFVLVVPVALAVAAMGLSVPLSGQSSAEETVAKNLIHGKYLVESVAGCGDCHTPFNGKGEPDRSKWLQGGPLSFAPLQPVPDWAAAAPPIAGLEGWTDDAATKFLMTGLDQSGKPARPPMPQFRLNKTDAAAVVTYLKSLKPANP